MRHSEKWYYVESIETGDIDQMIWVIEYVAHYHIGKWLNFQRNHGWFGEMWNVRWCLCEKIKIAQLCAEKKSENKISLGKRGRKQQQRNMM